MVDDELKKLGALEKERDAARAKWESSADAEALVRPLDPRERADFMRAVLPREEPAPARPRLFAWAGGLATAAAAAVALVVTFSTPALPRYSLEVPSLGYSAVRGEAPPSKVLQLVRGMALEVLLRPGASVKSEVAARSFVETANGRQSLDWAPEIAPTGAVRFAGKVGERPVLPAGASRLVFAVGRPSDVSRWAEGGKGEDELAVFRLDVVVAE